MEVDFLDWRGGKMLLENFLVIQRCWRGVQLPVSSASAVYRGHVPISPITPQKGSRKVKISDGESQWSSPVQFLGLLGDL